MILLEYDLKFVLLTGSAMMMALVAAMILFVVLYQRSISRKNKQIQQVEDTLRDQELDSVYSILDAQDEERKRIAKDLHDNVGSVLATLKMYADSLLKTSEDDREDLLKEISKITMKASDETRRLSHNLDVGLTEHFNFAESLDELVKTLNHVGKVNLELRGDLNHVPSNKIGIELFRIVQELVSNTIKHSKAQRAEIEVVGLGSSLSLIYTDNGVGFSVEKMTRGIGLKNMKSRIEKLEGEMEVESVLGEGSTFSFEIPYI